MLPFPMQQLFSPGVRSSSSCLRRSTSCRTVNIPTTTLTCVHASSRSAATSASASAAPSADPAVDRFVSRLLAAPHRDVTHVPYGDWFALYVGARKAWKARAGASPTAALSHGRSQKQEDHETQHGQAKASIDALLWSSLFARHWTEVQVHLTTASPAASHYRWWWNSEASFSLPSLSSSSSSLSAHTVEPSSAAAQPPALELCTSDFLTEPLLGGRYLRLWMEDVRASAAASTTSANSKGVSASPTVLVPFTAVWQIKQSAYWRPSAQQRSALPQAAAVTSLSLQERQARQALLQTVDQLLQLQADAAEKRGSSPPQLIRVLSPTQEWDLLCQAPRLRQVFYPSTSGTEAATSPPPAPPRWLSMGCLCEDASARLAYCAHALNWQRIQQQQQQQERQSSRSEAQSTPLRVLSPSCEHARLRGYALTSVHEHSSEKSALDRRQAARQQQSSSTGTPPGGGTSAATVHGQARKGCSDAVRRMSTREENIRQSFSVR
ncbi:hypothetical protein N2W54_001439 [Lotmaria passim]